MSDFAPTQAPPESMEFEAPPQVAADPQAAEPSTDAPADVPQGGEQPQDDAQAATPTAEAVSPAKKGLSPELEQRVADWKPSLPNDKLKFDTTEETQNLNPDQLLGDEDSESFVLATDRTFVGADGSAVVIKAGSTAYLDVAGLTPQDVSDHHLEQAQNSAYAEFGGTRVFKDFVRWAAEQDPPLVIDLAGKTPPPQLEAAFEFYRDTDHGKAVLADALLQTEVVGLQEKLEKAQESGDQAAVADLEEQLKTKVAERQEIQHLQPKLGDRLERAAQNRRPEDAAEEGMDSFRQLLEISGLTKEEIDEILGSTEPLVPEAEAAINQVGEVEKPEAKSSFSKRLEGYFKKLKKEEAFQKLRKLLEPSQRFGAMAENWMKNNADIGSFIRYLCTGEVYGRIGEELGYKSEEDLEKTGHFSIGAQRIEMYTRRTPKIELTLLCEGLKAAGICTEEDAARFLAEDPKKTLEGVEFANKLKTLLVIKEEKRELFNKKIAMIVSENNEDAQLSVEGFSYLMMIPESVRGGIAKPNDAAIPSQA